MTSRRETGIVLRPAAENTAFVREVATEAPVAIEVNGIGYAVLMATPDDLESLATGFLLTERLCDRARDILDIDAFETTMGWIVRAQLAHHLADRIGDRVRHRTSDSGCGLCGISGLEQVHRPMPQRPDRPHVAKDALFRAIGAIRDHQPLNARTGAFHAAAACDTDGRVIAACEDVGRHNALDKLIGRFARDDRSISGFLLVTSRISFEMVDKALVARAPMLVGISAATTLAVDHARAHGLTVAALARDDAILLLNDPGRVFADQNKVSETADP